MERVFAEKQNSRDLRKKEVQECKNLLKALNIIIFVLRYKNFIVFFAPDLKKATLNGYNIYN